MKAVLLTADAYFPRALRALLEPHDWELAVARDAAAGAALVAPAVCACAFVHGRDIDARLLETLRQCLAAGWSETFVIAEHAAPEWEERAYEQGASFVFTLPLRGPLVLGRLARLLPPPPSPQLSLPLGLPDGAAPAPRPATLAIIKDFGRLLRHANDADSFVAAYIEHLREVLGVNRLALYMTDESRGRRLSCSFATGLDPEIWHNVTLSLDTGLGAHARHHGLVIALHGPLPVDPGIRQEMEALGATLAVPVRARDQLLGVLLVGPRLLGEPLERDQIEILFMLMQDLALVLRNARLHAELSRERSFFASVLEQIHVGCLVLDADLRVIHVNPVMAACFGMGQPGELTFHSLPNPLSSLIYSVLQGRNPRAEYAHRIAGEPQQLYRVTVEPFSRGPGTKTSVLVLAHNQTQAVAERRIEVADARADLLRRMGEQFSHIFNNALTPIATFAQLLGAGDQSPEVLAGLNFALPRGIARLQRHVEQIYQFAHTEAPLSETIPLQPLLREAWERALAAKRAESDGPAATAGSWPNLSAPTEVPALARGSRRALLCACMEIFINAIEAAPGAPEVVLSFDLSHPGYLGVAVHDHGPGIPDEIKSHLAEPFATTKSSGLGLGLCVVQKVMREHNGTFRLGPSTRTKGTACSFSLPIVQ